MLNDQWILAITSNKQMCQRHVLFSWDGWFWPSPHLILQIRVFHKMS